MISDFSPMKTIPTISIVRGLRVLLDEDLAKIYGVETKVMNQAIKRNRERFPDDFMFQLTVSEYSNLRSQIVTSSYGGRRYMPFVFTEHGAIMLASVLKSKRAIQMSIEVVRAFVRLRNVLTSEIRSFVLKQSSKTDREFKKVWKIIEELANPDPDDHKTKIGFKLNN